MESPEHRIKLIQAESEQLGHYLHTLSADAWTQPSACQAWAVRDVVGHLILGAELYTNVITRGLQGNVSPLAGWPAAGTANAASASALLDQLSVARRESLGAQLLPTFHATDEHLCQLLAGRHSQAWNTPCYHPAGLLPVRTLVDFRLGEVVMHGWDIRSRFDPGAGLSPSSLPAFLDVLRVAMGWAFWPGTQYATAVCYRFTLTGSVPTQFDIVVAENQARLEPTGTARAHVCCRCDTATFVWLMYGRLPLARALATGGLEMDGEAALVTAFAQWFRGV
jgi:uncharacterized protein (TIGR03083 family)